MISDIGPGMRMLIDRLEAHEGDFAETFPLPNGWEASVIRKQELIPGLQELIPGLPAELKSHITEGLKSSYGAEQGLFEMALKNPLTGQLTNVEGFMSPVDVARKLRQWFELPEARGFRDASED